MSTGPSRSLAALPHRSLPCLGCRSLSSASASRPCPGSSSALGPVLVSSSADVGSVGSFSRLARSSFAFAAPRCRPGPPRWSWSPGAWESCDSMKCKITPTKLTLQVQVNKDGVSSSTNRDMWLCEWRLSDLLSRYRPALASFTWPRGALDVAIRPSLHLHGR